MLGALLDATAPSAMAAQAPSATRDCPTVIVDLDAKTVNGVNVDRPIAELRRAIGASRITAVVEALEGRSTKAWNIDFCGHASRRHWNGLSWTDPALRTADGLGVGAPLRVFDARYGEGTPFESESTGVRYRGRSGNSDFTLQVSPTCYQRRENRLMVDRGCTATSIFLPLAPELSK
jgi:hypothetical protein